MIHFCCNTDIELAPNNVLCVASVLKISLPRFLSVPIYNRSTRFHDDGSNWNLIRE